jgi:hypothetical protein
MKKIAITLALAGMIGTSFGQGMVNFANTSGSQNISTNNTVNIYGISQTPVGSGSGLTAGSGTLPQGFYYILLMQSYSGGATNNPTAATLLSGGWLSTGAAGTNVLGAGRVGGGATAVTAYNDTSTPSPGTPNQFVIAGWSSNVATNGEAGWATVSNYLHNGTSYVWPLGSGTIGYFGVSTVGTGNAINGIAELLFGTPGTTIQTGWYLYMTPVPEPSTIALAGLAGLSLLLFRRRK